MDIRAELAREHSKESALRITDWIGGDTARLEELLSIMQSEDYRLSQRAAYPLLMIAMKRIALFEPYVPQLITNLRQPRLHNAVKRNTLRILGELPLPQNEELLGELAERCFSYLADTKEAIAIRVFSMSVLWNICQQIPELSEELKILIEDHFEQGSAGFKSRGKKILQAIARQQKQ